MAARTREIGIRLALGAPRSSVARMVAREYFPLVSGSAAGGAVAAVGGARLMRGMLFGVAPNDYLMLAAAAVVLASVAVLAGWLPARRASRLDPMDALREE
jgi:ABC-type antimicrobial peptide transport system permease subunit